MWCSQPFHELALWSRGTHAFTRVRAGHVPSGYHRSKHLPRPSFDASCQVHSVTAPL